MSKSRDVRYGRRGGRWAEKPADVVALEAWRAQRDALEAATVRAAAEAGQQLSLIDALEGQLAD